MKRKLTLGIFTLLCGLFVLTAFKPRWADLIFTGAIIQTSPTYSGTFRSELTANGQVTMSVSTPGAGTFLIAGPGNAVDFGPSALTSLYRGATFGATVGGSQKALQTTYGNNAFNQNTGKTFIGQNVVDDGVNQLQVNGGAKVNDLKINTTTPPNVNDVWTADDALGNGSWKPSTGNTTAGTWTPTILAADCINVTQGAGTVMGLSSWTFTNVGANTPGSNAVITLSVTGTVYVTNQVSATKLVISLPPTHLLGTLPNAEIRHPVFILEYGATLGILGYVTRHTNGYLEINFISQTSFSKGFGFTIQFPTIIP